MLESVKKALRISGTIFDTEIQELIDAAMSDLKLSGISCQNVRDPLIRRAVTIYCKANFGLDNEDSEKYQKSYDMLKNHLSLAGDYNGVI